jgi:RNA polymerase sigma-70 factor (ECF subfamily)
MNNKTEILWEKFHNQLRSYILSRISDHVFVDDILQEVFIKIHSNIDGLNDETKIRSWVFQITRNTIIDYYRKQKGITVDIDTIQIADEIEEESPARDIAAGLKKMIDDLPEIYAQALLLVEFEGLTQSELAQKLGISISGAKSRVQRARRMLKDSLMRCCHFQFDKYGTIIEIHPVTCCCCN